MSGTPLGCGKRTTVHIMTKNTNPKESQSIDSAVDVFVLNYFALLALYFPWHENTWVKSTRIRQLLSMPSRKPSSVLGLRSSENLSHLREKRSYWEKSSFIHMLRIFKREKNLLRIPIKLAELSAVKEVTWKPTEKIQDKWDEREPQLGTSAYSSKKESTKAPLKTRQIEKNIRTEHQKGNKGRTRNPF